MNRDILKAGWFVLLSLLVGVTGCTNEQSSSSNKFVTAEGSQLYTPDGEPFRIRGTNLGNWLLPEGYMFKFENAGYAREIYGVTKDLLGPDDARLFWEQFRENYITRKDIEYLSKLGVNTIRVPFDYKLLTPEMHPKAWVGPGFTYLDRAIKWAGEFDMFVILDMHAAPGGQNGENIDDGYGYPFLMISEASQARTAYMWKKIAERYRDEPTVLGYDLLNEPIPHFEGYDTLNHRLEPIYKQIVDSIRTVDQNHLIYLGGSQWNTNFTPLGEPFDDKLGYTFHKYWMPPKQEAVQEYVDFREKYNVPIYMGESGENEDAWVEEFRTLLDENEFGWTFWPYKKMIEEDGFVQFAMPEGWEKIQAYAKRFGLGYNERREVRPAFDESRRIFDRFLENMKFENCTLNEGYVEALGLETVPVE